MRWVSGGQVRLGPEGSHWNERAIAVVIRGRRIELGAVFFKDEVRAKSVATKRVIKFCREVMGFYKGLVS